MGYTRNESKGGFKSSINRPVGSESEGRGDEYRGAEGDEGVKPIGEVIPNVEESGGINIWQIALAVVGVFTLVKMIK